MMGTEGFRINMIYYNMTDGPKVKGQYSSLINWLILFSGLAHYSYCILAPQHLIVVIKAPRLKQLQYIIPQHLILIIKAPRLKIWGMWCRLLSDEELRACIFGVAGFCAFTPRLS